MLLEETPNRLRVGLPNRFLESLDCRTLVGGSRLDVFLERRPARESVLARDDVLRVGEHDARFVRQLCAHARVCLGIAMTEGGEKFFRLRLLLLEVGTRGQRSTKR